MIPGIQVVQSPAQLSIHAQGTQGTGAIPGAGASIVIPLFKGNTVVVQDILNDADNSVVNDTIGSGTFSALRFCGLWIVDVMVFQNGPATIELRERPPDVVTQAVPGATDTTRTVWTRVIRNGITFRQTWRAIAAETRIVYTNGASTLTQFALSVIARAV